MCCFVLLLLLPRVLSVKVLFLGNSYTTNNNLMGMVRTMLQETELDVTVSGYNKAGYRFDQHLADIKSAANSKLDDEDWDVIVLQEQSQTGGFASQFMTLGMRSVTAAVGLNDIIASSTNAQTLFFMTWGRRDGDSRNPHLYPDFPTMNALLEDGYVRYVQRTSTVNRPTYLAPVGLAFAELYGTDQFQALYKADGSHPSVQGTYLAACVFYARITGKDAQDTRYTPETVSASDAEVLRRVAMKVVLEQPLLPTGDAGTPPPSPLPTLRPAATPPSPSPTMGPTISPSNSPTTKSPTVNPSLPPSPTKGPSKPSPTAIILDSSSFAPTTTAKCVSARFGNTCQRRPTGRPSQRPTKAPTSSQPATESPSTSQPAVIMPLTNASSTAEPSSVPTSTMPSSSANASTTEPTMPTDLISPPSAAPTANSGDPSAAPVAPQPKDTTSAPIVPPTSSPTIIPKLPTSRATAGLSGVVVEGSRDDAPSSTAARFAFWVPLSLLLWMAV